jgi:soluble lytic murein transglycosylase-like protein
MMRERDIHLLIWCAFLSILIYFAFEANEVFGRPQPDAVPPMAFKLRSDLIRTSRFAFGLSAPSATFGAQIHQESNYQADASNRSGAKGLAQFMPRTALGMSQKYKDLRPPTPYSPAWSMLALARYNKEHYDRLGSKFTQCQRLKLTLAAYNGGYGVLKRKQWPKETIYYVKRIIYQLEPLYEAAHFGPGSGCHPKG